MVFSIPSADFTNPDGTRLYQVDINAGRRGMITMQCIVDPADPDSYYRLKDLSSEIERDIQSFITKPEMPKLDRVQNSETDLENDGVSLDGLPEILEKLRAHGEKEMEYIRNALPLEMIFDKAIKPYLDAQGIKLEDKIWPDGDRNPALFIKDYPVVNYDKMSRVERINQDHIKKEFIHTESYYNKGELSNHNGVAKIGSRVTIFHAYEKIKHVMQAAQKIENGKTVDLSPEEHALYRAAIFKSNKKQTLNLNKIPGSDMSEYVTEAKNFKAIFMN